MNDGSTCPKGCGVTLVELAAGASHRQNCPLSSAGRLKQAVEAVLFGGEVPPASPFSVDAEWLRSLAQRVRDAAYRQMVSRLDELKTKVAQLEAEIRTTDQILASRNELLALFDCPAHGACVPHAIDEVKRLRQDVDATWRAIGIDPAEAKRDNCWLAPSVASHINAFKKPKPRIGVVPLVAVGERLILGKRRNGVHAGKWILPGGGVEFREGWRDAGVREFLEETGMRIEIRPDENPITVMEIIGRDTHRVCLVVAAKALDPADVLRPSDELSEVRGFTFAELSEIEMTQPVRGCLERLGFLRKPAHVAVTACIACAEQPDDERCPKSQRTCGHHCNHSWTHDGCCWCGAVFKPETV